MAGKLDLSATLRLTDLISQPLKNISRQAKQMQQDIAQSTKAVQAMQQTLGKADKLTQLTQKLKETQKEITKVAEAEKKLKQAIDAAGAPTAKQSRELEKLGKTLTTLNQRQDTYRQRMGQLGRALKEAGFNTKNFGQSQSDIHSRIESVNQAIDRQRRELNQLREAQRRLNKAQQEYKATSEYASTLKSNGISAMMAGASTLYALSKPLNEAKHFQTEQTRVASLGLGQIATDDAFKYAKEMKTYGTSTLENLQLVRDGMTAFADEHHAQMVAPLLAKMKFANEAMYGAEGGAENEKKFMDMLKVIEMRNGLKNQAAFREQANIIQQVITATGGRVQPEEWLNTIKTGGVAAKLMDNKAFYYTMEPMVQEMGGHRVGTAMMSAYQNLYQGRTTKRALGNLDKFDLIADRSKVKNDKAGQTSFLDIGAIKGADLFRSNQFAWLEQVLVPAIKAKGITKDNDIMDAIGSIFSNRTASNLFAQMYMQRQQIHKNQKFNAGADNIDQLDQKARGTAAGQELEAKAKLHDAYLSMGQTVLPIYAAALQKAAVALQKLSSLMQQHPALTKAIATGLLAIGVGLVVFGAMAVAIGSVLGPLALLRYSLITLRTVFSIGSIVSKFSTAITIIRTGLAGVGLMTSPILFAIMGIAVVAVVIIKYWQPIKAFFAGLWQGISAGLQPAFASLRSAIAPLSPIISSLASAFRNLLTPMHFSARTLSTVKTAGYAVGYVFSRLIGIIVKVVLAFLNIAHQISSVPATIIGVFAGLPSQMSNIGGHIMEGLRTGLASRAKSVVASIRSVASEIKSAFTGAMSIHSPSRVFMGYGDNIMQGLHIGLMRNNNPINTMLATSHNLRNAIDTSTIRFDNRRPISATMTTGNHTAPSININIYPQPSQSPADIAQLVAQELAKAKLGQTSHNTALYDLPDAWN